MKKIKKVKELILKLHAFELNNETRRMVCVDCQGVMNQCPASCPGLSGENRHALARQFVGSLGKLLKDVDRETQAGDVLQLAAMRSQEGFVNA